MKTSFAKTCAVFRREFRSYFDSPVAYVFLTAFLVLTGFLTFSVTMLTGTPCSTMEISQAPR